MSCLIGLASGAERFRRYDLGLLVLATVLQSQPQRMSLVRLSTRNNRGNVAVGDRSWLNRYKEAGRASEEQDMQPRREAL